MAVSILLLLAGVVVLSAATRRPGLHVSTAPWHLFKAGHMARSEGPQVCYLRVNAEAQFPPAAPEAARVPTPSSYFFHEEVIPPANAIVVRVRHFRAPPIQG